MPEFEIKQIKNGWVVEHNITQFVIGTDEVYFKTLKQATSYCIKKLKRYGETYG